MCPKQIHFIQMIYNLNLCGCVRVCERERESKLSRSQSKNSLENNLTVSGNPRTLGIWAYVGNIQPENQEIQQFPKSILHEQVQKNGKNFKWVY